MSKKMHPPLENEIKNLGFWLVILGFIHILASGIFSFYWGFILILLGIFSLVYKKLVVFLIFGIVIGIAGLSNISSALIGNLLLGGGLVNYFWLLFGGFQIYWGITTVIRYSKIKEKINRHSPSY